MLWELVLQPGRGPGMPRLLGEPSGPHWGSVVSLGKTGLTREICTTTSHVPVCRGARVGLRGMGSSAGRWPPTQPPGCSVAVVVL